MIYIKNKEQIDLMTKSGAIIKDVLELVKEHAKVGITTKQLDTLAYNYIKKCNATPSFLNYNGFPGTLCTSIDDEVVHGIPSSKILEEGMLLKIDAGACLNGWHSDAARTFAIGKVSAEKEKLMLVCKDSFFKGIEVLKDGARLGDLGNSIQIYVEAFGFSVVRSLVGHGVGKNLHEDPNVPNFGTKGRGTRLSNYMTLAIEPMINVGTKDVVIKDDNWTVVTADGKPSAHYENTIAILPDGIKILTL